MAKRTKKVGPAGRFQARYGVRSRTRLRNIELIQRRNQLCPSCGHKTVKRISTGIWRCRKCGIKFAGGSYIPKTEVGQHVEKALRGDLSATELPEEEEEGEEL